MDPRLEISLEASREINPNFQLKDIVEIEVTPRDFGRIAAQTAKQVVTQRIREAERGLIYNAFIEKEEDIVTGIVQRQDKRNIYVDLGKVEAVLPLTELMPTDKFKHGDRIKAYITKVENTTKGLKLSYPVHILVCLNVCLSSKCLRSSMESSKFVQWLVKQDFVPKSLFTHAMLRLIQ